MMLEEKLPAQQDKDMITFKQTGDFIKLNNFFEKALEVFDSGILDKYGKKGVEALAAATPKDSGRAANSWYYEIVREKGSVKLIWSNSDIEGGCNVAILIQYGHATKDGSRVPGVDFINPAIQPIFEELSKEVTKGV